MASSGTSSSGMSSSKTQSVVNKVVGIPLLLEKACHDSCIAVSMKWLRCSCTLAAKMQTTSPPHHPSSELKREKARLKGGGGHDAEDRPDDEDIRKEGPIDELVGKGAIDVAAVGDNGFNGYGINSPAISSRIGFSTAQYSSSDLRVCYKQS